MDFEIRGKVALVTGAAQGIGKATATVFAKNGVNLVACDINYEKLLKSCEEFSALGVKVLPVQMDVGNYESIQNGVQKGVDEFGHIDILLNCAGIIISEMLLDLPLSSWERVMDVNLKSVFMLSTTVVRHMIEKGIKGRIITVSSMSSKIGEFGNGVYSCTKAAINNLTQTMGQEWAKYGICVTAVAPGYVNTELMVNVFNERGPLEGMTPEEYKNALCSRISLGRMCEPSEVGELMAFLASPASAYITGVTVTIAGGSCLL